MEPVAQKEESCSGSPTSCWSSPPPPRERRHPKACSGGVPLAIVGLLLTCTSLSVKAQVASNTAARGQAAGGSSVSSTSQFDPVHSFNPTAEIAALQGINPSELAARTAANARLASKGVPAVKNSSNASAPAIISPNPVIAQALLGAYGVPPGPDLPASVGKPTADAAFVLTPDVLKEYLRSQQQALSTLPVLSASTPGGYGSPGSAPAPAPAPQPAGRHLLQAPRRPTSPLQTPTAAAGGAAPARGVVGVAGSYGGLPPATAIAPGVYGIATAPGVYGVVGRNGVLGAYRQPGLLPPTRSLDTR